MTQFLQEKKRWENYRLANDLYADVRKIEFEKLFELIGPSAGKTILEIGTGNGRLTLLLANSVGKSGTIFTCDYQKLSDALLKKLKEPKLSIQILQHKEDYAIPLLDNSVDKISSIATIHHYDDRSLRTGTTGRKKLLKELFRILKPGGKIILADVAKGTSAQKYFDEGVDTPFYCSPRGHPHDFLNKQEALALCEQAGFQNMNFDIEEVPWQFENDEQAKNFLHTLHNAKCSPEESLELAKKYLDFHYDDERLTVDWQLFYLTATKN